MRKSRFTPVVRFILLAAVPVAMAVNTGVAGAQGYPDQRYPSQRRAGNGQQQQQELFEWVGRVDREIRIQAGRNDAAIINMGSNERNNGGRIRGFNRLPRQDGTVTVQVLEGRGNVDVIQQPNARNGYTAVIRLRDQDSGSARYRIAAYFTPSGYNNGGYGRRR